MDTGDMRTLVPAMAAGMLRKEKPQKPGLLDKVYPAYRKAVSWSIHHKLVVLGVSLLLLVGSAGAALARGFAFMPNIDMNTVNLTISMPEGCTREQAVALADEALQRIAAVDNMETVGAMMSSASGAGSMDMTSMITFLYLFFITDISSMPVISPLSSRSTIAISGSVSDRSFTAVFASSASPHTWKSATSSRMLLRPFLTTG